MRLSIRNLFELGRQASFAILRSYRKHGARETLFRVLRQFRIRTPDILGQAFDREFGTDTEGIVPLSRLAVASDNRIAGIRYQSLSPKLIRQSIQSLPIDHSQFQFVDYGSGKGRVLMVASEFPFRSVIGVEFAKELHDIAVKNIAKHPLASRKNVQSVWIDAAEFDPPSGSLVVFFYNPFELSVMSHVLRKLYKSVNKNAYDVYIIYWNPVHIQAFVESGIFVELEKDESLVVLKNK